MLFVLTELIKSDKAQGRTGKGLLLQAIKMLRNLETVDGKQFDPDNVGFRLDRVNESTNILALEDTADGFNIKGLFSMIADGMQINIKNKPSKYLNYEISPKVAITSNSSLYGHGSSYNARIREVGLTNYFSSKHTPIDEFGYRFFDDWNIQQWDSFINLMVNCLQDYQAYGLPIVEEIKDIKAEFQRFGKLGLPTLQVLEDETINHGYKILKPELKNKIQDETGGRLSSQNVKKYLEVYCTYKGLRLEVQPSNGLAYYRAFRD